MKKLLVVLHSLNTIYGAGRSATIWLNESHIKYDLLYPKGSETEADIKKFYEDMKNKPQKMIPFWQPMSMCIMGKESLSWRGRIWTKICTLMFLINKLKFKKIVEDYDLVYLNSLILWPMIVENNKFIIHIRCVFNDSEKIFKKIEKKLEIARCVIFIDWSTMKPFEHSNIHSIILNNPFDMEIIKDLDTNSIIKKYDLNRNKTAYLVIGKISKDKGVRFIIKSFIASNIDAYLIIAGEVHGRYASMCVRDAKKHANIRFIGEIKENYELFAIADYVIRGDNIFCIGRTIYEGLYAGCNVIIPGKNKDIEYMADSDEYINNIFFYRPRDEKDLSNVFQNTNGKNVIERKTKSNVKAYVDQLMLFCDLNTESN